MAKKRNYKVTDKYRSHILSTKVDRKLRENDQTPTSIKNTFTYPMACLARLFYSHLYLTYS